MSTAERLLLNTAALYFRVGVSTALGLVSSRFILAALGVVDFGLFSVVAGIMGFLGFLNSAMATSSQRHLTHALGSGDHNEVNRIFNACFLLHAILAAVLAVLGETFGLWFLNEVLNVPELRRDAAFWVLQSAVLGTVCYVIAVPSQALLTAHESFVAVSFIGIIQSVLNFTLAIVLVRAPGDRLITYVVISGIIAVIITAAQGFFCRMRFPESRLAPRLFLNARWARELLGFSGWSLFGSLSVVARLQGAAFLLNIFFGPAINAAYGVASQVGSMMNQLAQAMHQAVSPRLVKQEGAGNRIRMLESSLLTIKYSFFLACFWTIPLLAETQTVFRLWLENPPAHSVMFCRLVLLMFLMDQLSAGCSTVAVAIGSIARYQTVVGGIHLATLPLAYLFLALGYSPNSVLYCSLATMTVASAVRGLVLRTVAGFSYKRWLGGVVFRGVLGVLPSAVCAFVLASFVPPSLGRLVIIAAMTGASTFAGILLMGAARPERERIIHLARAVWQRASFGRPLEPAVPHR